MLYYKYKKIDYSHTERKTKADFFLNNFTL